MALVVRGLLWFGLYVTLTVLPLAVAWWERPAAPLRPVLVEAAAAAGLVALPLMVFQFALVSRLGPASRPFGTDALVQFHSRMGVVGLAAVVAHALLLLGHGIPLRAWNPFGGPVVWQSGAVALWGVALISFTSVFRRRLRLPYEAWQALHLALAVLVVGATVVHILAVQGYAGEPGLRALVVAYAAIAALLLGRYRLLRPLQLWRRPWEVVANTHVGGRTRLLRVRPVGHRGFEFEPGQFAWMMTGRSPLWSAQHPISMASSAERPPDGAVEFAIKALGDWSGTMVPGLRPGARVWVDGAFGAFTPEGRPAQGYVLVAGGIGIAPMRSILLTLRDREDARPVVLFYAARDWSGVAFREDLEALRQQMPLEVVYVFEAPDPEWGGERGLVDAGVLGRHLPRQYRRYQFFVCGPPAMMDAVEAALLGLGVPAAAVQTERYEMV